MKSYDYNAVTYDGACYCTECLPEGVDVENEEVSPIFAGSEWDYYPVCDKCGEVHEYVGLTTDGQNRIALNDALSSHESGEYDGFSSTTKQEFPDDDYEGEWLHINERGNCTLYVRSNSGKDREIASRF